LSGGAAVRLRDALRRLQARARGSALLHRLVVGTRLLLAVGFLPTGVVKLLGRPFTTISLESPVGLFFHVLHQSGVYWTFLGLMQVLAAVLILVPRTAPLGAALFFPIILNIFVITVGVGFTGTPWITAPMVLASLLLLCWDYHRFEGLLFAPRRAEPAWVAPPPRVPLSRLERVVFAVGLAAGMVAAFGVRGLTPPSSSLPAVAIGFAAGLAAVVLGLRAAWIGRGGRRASPLPTA
jgi:hypothetical protein